MKDKRLGRINVRSVIQHFLAAFIVLVLLFSMLGTNILINGVNGDVSYSLHEADKSRAYEESYLFNNILGNNISNVLRLVAQRSQVETDGQYDGDKIIDVTAYVNRGSVLLGGYVTAHYHLSDLLKWAQNGFDLQTKNMTAEEWANFFAEETTYTHLKNNVVSGGMNSYLSSQLDDNSIASTKARTAEFEDGEHDILTSRYQTIDGKNIENIVSGFEEYDTLRQSVESASVALLSNYNEYIKNLPYYSYQNSNLRYYISRTINGKTEIYTNVSDISSSNVLDTFKDYGKYIYYCPNELSYETNTLIKENIVRSMIKNYSYAFPDQIKVYIGVDTNAYPCEDDFTQGKAGFAKYSPYKSQLYFLCGLSAFLYVLLLIISITQISVTPENTENRTATEIIALRGLLIIAVPVGISYFASTTYDGSIDRLLENPIILILIGIGVFIADIGLLDLIYGLTEKGKSGLLWKDSLIKKLAFGAKDVVVNTTNNASVIVRTWVPYVMFVTVNILLVLIGLPGIIIAVILDILVGIFTYRQNLDRDKIIHVIENIKNGDVGAKVDVSNLRADNIALADAVNSIGDGIKMAVDTSMKDEKMKADLITNVSHDIKTPLTSIINYVDLIKREKIANDKVKEYVDVLDLKSQKLKQLTEDLVDVAKISSGNIKIDLQRTDFVELVNQTIGEFYEKFEDSNLAPIFRQRLCVLHQMRIICGE